MSAAIEIFRGDTRILEIPIVDAANAPVDVTGWAFVLSLAKSLGGTPDVEVQGVITDAQGGLVQFELTPNDTDAVGNYFYDVQATTPQGRVYTVDFGRIHIVQDVSL
jgi:hypothetical protein